MPRRGSETPESAKAVFRASSPVLGGRPTVMKYGDEGERFEVDVLTCHDAPNPGYCVHATVNLHLERNEMDGTNIPVELMAVAADADEFMANAISTAAFCVMKDGWLAAPGVVFPDAIGQYGPTTTPHIMWSEPSEWPELCTVAIEGFGDVHWLLAIPLNDQEVGFLHREGYDALEGRLADQRVAYFDLQRASVVDE